MNLDQLKSYHDYRSVEHDLGILLRFIDLSENHYCTNSGEIRKIILASCSAIESCIPLIQKELDVYENKKSDESIADFIYRILNDQGYHLENLQPILHYYQFNPWKERKTWWKAYNTIKHADKNDNNILFFKAAIESVLAFFAIMVFLTRKSGIGIFWHQHDLVKINEKGLGRSINYLAQIPPSLIKIFE
ncbi:MAG: hypothetical protein FJX71_04600 [Alphaproteobacteria bacterium]|nr:hypothetical protein [Alphaproteobacteria bacterium]